MTATQVLAEVFTFQPLNRMLRACFCSSPEGTTLSQPRVERREENERRATLGGEDHPTSEPQRGGPSRAIACS